MFDFSFNNIIMPFDPVNKPEAFRTNVVYFLSRTQSIFEYENLPETIPARELEKQIQIAGYTSVFEKNGKLYASHCGFEGLDPYYRPVYALINNPPLNMSTVKKKIDDDVVIIPNDSYFIGLYPIIAKYAALMVESDISLRNAIINTRLTDLITADTDVEKQAAEQYLENIIAGKLGVIGTRPFLEGINVHSLSAGTTNNVSQAIEGSVYARATLWNELGLNANFNMKREAIAADEAGLNRDALLPLIDDMLRERRNAVKKINDIFGTAISITLSSAWAEERKEVIEGGAEEENNNESEIPGLSEGRLSDE